MASSARYVEAPKDLSSAGRVQLGARQYHMVCANCHGAPNIGQSAVALSMSPRPQYLPRVLDQFSDEDLFVIVQNGVKFSAMPSWPNSTRDDAVWSMVAFLRQLPKMDAKTYLDMTASPLAPEMAPVTPLGDQIALRPSSADRAAPPVEEFLYAAPAIGFSDRVPRTHPVALCAGCHGKDGDGSATGGEAPNLTLHDSDYLRAALEAYSNGTRKSGFMQEIASQLSIEQVSALADYYAALPMRKLQAATQPDPALIKRGETIALQGIKENAAPACANCHESRGSELSGAPRIAGQSEVYLRRQLTAMRRGGRGSTGTWNPMPAEAHDLSNDDIAALAAYYATQEPTKGGTQTAAATWPTGDVERGQAVVTNVCKRCHLNEGRGDSIGTVPDITLHAKPYILQTLYAFRARIRENNQMLETTRELSYADIADVAEYLGTLPPEKAIATVSAAPRESTIAEKGDNGRGIPACLSCHDAKGVTALPLIPRLQGQSPVYLKARLDLFASIGEYDFSSLNPMPAIASKLTAEERADLAAYFAAQTPLAKSAEH
ncbi:MAG: c-type cytochrome [Methylobacteriaceae bacterium]|nr:c-type cytochrome [Methylobacteriaceae bacterium]